MVSGIQWPVLLPVVIHYNYTFDKKLFNTMTFGASAATPI